ncbi:neutral/alkaline non-lysosomal ceramidase N-terminal domain-containing protein [Mesobacillus harenae]|uniref:neutral/alkaline non-lysosomal ceramidase N-terminal domain-containing protein n=1 Tax=Mesobacillus harenae TaxID=2213203 RepID=UPI00157FD307|nr:neutral/alkaline non-lysosomal ceramidase N-terminal domain-containing protein [Mesobacillus harenae]
MKAILKLGTAKVEITPQFPVALAGFKERKGSFEGVAHPLHLRVLFFQLEEADRICRSILISADLIWWDTSHAKNLRKRIADRWGLEESAVILHATHTHSGPQTSNQFTPSLGCPVDGYLQFLEDQLMAALEQASVNIEPVTMEHGIGKCEIGIHRRKLVKGKCVMAPNPDGPTDQEVHVICFRTAKERFKAIITHYACHPTTTADNSISSEYPGVAMDLVENHYGKDSVALFLQGCSGDIRPALVKNGLFYRGTDLEVKKLGKKLADEVLWVAGKTMSPLKPVLKNRKVQTSLSFKTLPTLAELRGKVTEPDVMGEWSSLLLAQPDRINLEVPIEFTYLQIANSLAFLAINAEVVVDYGLWIKKTFAGKVLPIPYSNGMLGYIPTAKQTEEGGYEAEESLYYFGLPAPFSVSIEKEIKKSIITLEGGEHF